MSLSFTTTLKPSGPHLKHSQLTEFNHNKNKQMKTIHTLLNLVLIGVIAAVTSSCAGTATNFPPITIKGKVDGRDIAVTYYPDKSKPAEVIIGDGGPLVVDISK